MIRALLGGIIGPKTIDALGWILIALLLIAAAFFLGRCDGAQSERRAQEAARVKANADALQRDAQAKEQAATERAGDIAAIEAKRKDQVDALQGDDDGVRVRAACQRLRAAGTREADLPEQCRSGG